MKNKTGIKSKIQNIVRWLWSARTPSGYDRYGHGLSMPQQELITLKANKLFQLGEYGCRQVKWEFEVIAPLADATDVLINLIDKHERAESRREMGVSNG